VAVAALDEVGEPDGVGPAVRTALGLREGGRDPWEQAAAFLAPRRLLLVLDNAEHVLGAAPDIARLAARTGGAVLVTSRAPLRVAAEREVALEPLGVPRPDEDGDPARVLATEAVRLFAERAAANGQPIGADAVTAADVAAIVRRLDGLPLALELAAGWARLLPPAELRRRLEERPLMLTDGRRDLPARQRTLRDAVAWSYDLLAPAEQALFRRLSVFVGGFPLDAAERAGGADGGLEALAALRDHSLVIRAGDGAPRFRMLETIRHFGHERLAADREDGDARAAHARYGLDLAFDVRLPTLLAAESRSLGRIDAEHANLEAALRWLAEHGPEADFVALAAALQGYWFSVSEYRAGRAWLEQALACRNARPLDRARAMVGLARLAGFQGDRATAEPLFAAGLPVLRADAGPIEVAAALTWRGAVANHAGAYDAAAALLREALALAEAAGGGSEAAAAIGNARANLGVLARERRAYDEAVACHEAALAGYRRHDLDLGETRSLVDLGDVYREAGDLVRSVAYSRAAIGRVGPRGDMRLVADSLMSVAAAALAWGIPLLGAGLMGFADALRERVGTTVLLPIDCAAHGRLAADLRRALGAAACQAAWTEGRRWTRERAEAVAAEVAATAPGFVAAGSRPAPVVGNGAGLPLELTPREADVLRLLAERRTNREIADALFISPRTVGWHAAAILRKLGLASRRDVPAFLAGRPDLGGA
jgi:predicted ATPase/DNA-binding CsgD family transcriptional regulator